MTAKHRGGRGRRAVNKHETVTISLPPVLKAALDAAVTPEVSRSEVVAELIARYLLTPKPAPIVTETDEQSAPSLEGVSALKVLSAVIDQRTRNGWRWNNKRYAPLEQQLAQSGVIRLMRQNGKNIWRTAQGDALRPSVLLKLMKSGNIAPLS